MNTNRNEKLLYKDLSYEIQGAAMEVRKNFGSGLKESVYQNAFAEELASRNLKFEREKSIQILSPKTGKLVGSYRPDFVVDGRILVEVKAVAKIPKMFLDQIYSYLRNSEYELGYFVNFSSPKLYIKRVIFTNDRKTFLKKLLVSIGLIFVFFSVLETHAAAFIFQSDQPEIRLGDVFSIDLLVDTEGEIINAVEGVIVFPSDTLELVEVNDGDTIVNFWIERPKLQTPCGELCEVSFSGVIPGGFEGVLGPFYVGTRPGKILRLFFQAKSVDIGILYLVKGIILLHDGKGTPAPTTLGTLGFEVLPARAGEEPGLDVIFENDRLPPEPFLPEFVRDPSLFNNRWALVFSTQDKESGIAYYEVKEGKRTFDRAESPYLLKNQLRYDEIIVRAADKGGNVREVTIPPQRERPFWVSAIFWLILLAGLYIIARVLPRLWKGFYAQGER